MDRVGELRWPQSPSSVFGNGFWILNFCQLWFVFTGSILYIWLCLWLSILFCTSPEHLNHIVSSIWGQIMMLQQSKLLAAMPGPQTPRDQMVWTAFGSGSATCGWIIDWPASWAYIFWCWLIYGTNIWYFVSTEEWFFIFIWFTVNQTTNTSCGYFATIVAYHQ